MSSCRVVVHQAGSTAVRSTVPLAGQLGAGGVHTVCTSVTLLSLCIGAPELVIDGDNPVALECTVNSTNTLIDVIGEVGFDPGTAWGTDPLDTHNVLLTRACSVTIGDRNASDDFTLTNWSQSTILTSGLGTRVCL